MKLYTLLILLIFCFNQAKGQNDSASYTAVVDSAPKYMYGEYQFSRFIQINMATPYEAMRKALKGKVYISFIVDTMGKVINPKIAKDIGGGCGEEAKKAIQLTSGLWIPGSDKGKKTNALLTIPIAFNYENFPVNSKTSQNTDKKYFAKYYYDRGVEDLKANRLLTSIFYFTRSLEQISDYVDAFHYRGNAKLQNQDKDGACSDWNSALKLGNKSVSELLDKNCK